MNKEWDNPHKQRELIEREKKRSEQRFREGKSPTKAPFSQSIRPGLPIKGAKEGKWFQEWTKQWATECLRVLKPGGYLLSFGGTRTYHRMTCGIEDAGFEIRDCIMWVYGSGFPKSYNIAKGIDAKLRVGKTSPRGINKSELSKNTGQEVVRVQPNCGILGDKKEVRKRENAELVTSEAKQWEGWGTALKPACEPIVVARKPLSEPNVVQNVLKWGTGGINIDESRIPSDEITGWGGKPSKGYSGGLNHRQEARPVQGRFPANLILECICDKEGKEFVSGSFPKIRGETTFFGLNKKHSHRVGQVKDKAIIHTNPDCPCYILDQQGGKLNKQAKCKSDNRSGWQDSFVGGKVKHPKERELYLDTGGASRFFYVAKASRAERNMGLGNTKNVHPTVKPISLIKYLVKLITPPGGIVLDPFIGSGTTAIACKELGFRYIGIEKEEEYVKIAKARIDSISEVLI